MPGVRARASSSVTWFLCGWVIAGYTTNCSGKLVARPSRPRRSPAGVACTGTAGNPWGTTKSFERVVPKASTIVSATNRLGTHTACARAIERGIVTAR